MRISSFTVIGSWLGLWTSAPATTVAATVKTMRPDIDGISVDTAPNAAQIGAGGAVARSDIDVALPSAGTVEEPAERSLLASIAAHAAMSAVTAPRREPDDFVLARRLEVIARLNRPVGQAAASKPRQDGERRVKKSRPGTLSPVLARGTRPAFSTPLAAAA